MANHLLRIVDAKLAEPIVASLTEHEQDLIDLGWTVDTITFPNVNPKLPFQARDLAEDYIWPAISTFPDLHVFLIGNLPLPRSGWNTNPNGHGGNSGAYTSTAYFAMPYPDKWTDKRPSNIGYQPSQALLNVPGDGKWDQDLVPGPALASIGVLNLQKVLTRAQDWHGSPDRKLWTVEAYKRYFDNLHAYKHDEWVIKTPVVHGAYLGNPWPNFVGFFEEYEVPFFKSRTNPTDFHDFEPIGTCYSFKALDGHNSFWYDHTGPAGVMFFQFASYQVDAGSSNLVFPLVAGWLATGCWTFGGWNLTGWQNKTLGELWRQTVSPLDGASYKHLKVLYGDPTIRIKVPEL